MDLSPNDIRNYEFNTQMRGYDKEEVESLLDQVATGWEDAKQDNLKLSMEIDSLKSQIENLKQFEDTIKKAAIDARRSADETVAKAKEEAAKTMADAEREAAEMVGSKVHEVKHLKDQIEELEQTKRSFISELRQLIVQHQDMIDEIASSDVKKELSNTAAPSMSSSEPASHNDSNGFEVTDSTDVTRDNIETLANDGDDSDNDEADDSGEVPTMEQEEDDEQPQSGYSKPSEDEAPVDDELAQALNNYHADESKASEEPPAASAPKPGEFVETNKSAEEVPEEFIPVGEVKTSDPNADTDKVRVQAQQEPAVAEDIAAELDSVVAKFEEEMDKAEKS